MSIISSFHVDDSAALAKQFAALTATYIDHPPDTKADPATLVPLENVFRLLEMFRYNAYGDESRGGVLAMDTPNELYQMQLEAKPWQEGIVQALENALQQAYGAVQKEAAIDELQGSLRQLVSSHVPEHDAAARAKTFLNTFEAHLA